MSAETGRPDELAPTPPMGWNSWNTFGQRVDEETVRQSADALVSSGLRDCGYNYVVIDDCWSVKDGRDGNGDLMPDPERFPNGIKPLADYVHARALSWASTRMRPSGPAPATRAVMASRNRMRQSWAGWGVDFLKYDYCHAPAGQDVAIERYTRMGNALRKTGRPILFSLCEWGGRHPLPVGQTGRRAHVAGDRRCGRFMDRCVRATYAWWGLGIDRAIDIAAGLHEYAGPGCWNDMDMLVVGVGGKGISRAGAPASWNTVRRCRCGRAVFAADDRRDIRSMTPETAELTDEPRGAGGEPGSAGQAGGAHQADRPTRGLEEGTGRRIGSRGPAQSRLRRRAGAVHGSRDRAAGLDQRHRA